MKNLSVIILCLVLILGFAGCSSNNCQVNTFTIESLNIEARVIGDDNLTDTPWNNEFALPINRLAIQIDFPKNFNIIPGQDDFCLPRFVNSNLVKKMRLVSSQNFNINYPIGSDLFDLCLFAQRIPQWIERDGFQDQILNQSNFTSYLIVFNLRPEMEALHVLQVVLEMEDGSTILSNELEVRLIPLV